MTLSSLEAPFSQDPYSLYKRGDSQNARCKITCKIEGFLLLKWEHDSQYVYIKFLEVANHFRT